MVKKISSFTRRDVFRFSSSIALLGISPMIFASANKVTKAGQVESCDLIEESNPAAQGLKYVHDTNKAENKVERMGVEGKDQKCDNCQFYKQHNDKVGKCPLLPQGCVASKGWCSAWVKKA